MIIAICGPTGVGKTKLSIALAKKYNAKVINYDAVQVYKYLDIGSAKVTKDEMENVTHLLLDIKNPDEEYSVCDYQKDLRDILDNSNDNYILVGGTGLYLTAALYDYKFTQMDNKSYDEYSNDMLYEMALKKDQSMLIHKNNRQRLITFLNKKDVTTTNAKLLYNDTIFIGLSADRKVLYERINKRVDKMINDGLIEEVKSLYEKYPTSRVLSSAIGYKEIISYLNGNTSLEEAIELIKKLSRHYAKRQFTWYNNKLDVKWFETDYNNFDNTINSVIDYINKKTSN